MFMCRWPNGDLSFVFARNREDAIIMLDEWDNAELAELRQIQSFMVDFNLTDEGELELQAFGERSQDDIWDRAYPVIDQARRNAPRNSAGELTEPGKEMMREAVQAEKQRLTAKKKLRVADTELGRLAQSQMGAPAALVNRQVKQAAIEVLKKSPTSGPKQ
jgi:endonuclease/exonuclease/phosphatase family metal-dependent hydrolase